jgi:hypothetical protein
LRRTLYEVKTLKEEVKQRLSVIRQRREAGKKGIPAAEDYQRLVTPVGWVADPSYKYAAVGWVPTHPTTVTIRQNLASIS